MDPDSRRVLFATPGETLTRSSGLPQISRRTVGTPEAVGNVTRDMSVAFIAGVRDHMSNVDINRFHIMKQFGEAVDEVRRAEAPTRPALLKRTRGCG